MSTRLKKCGNGQCVAKAEKEKLSIKARPRQNDSIWINLSIERDSAFSTNKNVVGGVGSDTCGPKGKYADEHLSTNPVRS